MTGSKTGIHVVFFIPNSNTYVDRIKTLKAAAELVGKITVLVGVDDCLEKIENSEVFFMKSVGFKPGDRFGNILKASRQVASLNDVDVIHDTFGNLMITFITQRLKDDRPVLLSSFYALDRWRINHVWKNQGYKIKDLIFTRSGLRMYLGALSQYFMARLSDFVILQAEGLVEPYTESVGMANSSVKVITNSVDTNYWTPLPKRVNNDCKDILKLVFVGGLDDSHGLFPILKVLHRLIGENYKIKMNVITKPGIGEIARVEEFIQNHSLQSHVIMETGLSREQMRDRYRSADCLIYQTINDGSPRVVAEALSCGVSVIASKHPGIEVLDDGKEFIKFTLFSDEIAIANEIKQFINKPDLLKISSVLGRNRMIDKFHIDVVGKEYACLYKTIVNN